MIVTTYGIMEIRFGDTTLLCAARDLIPLQRPNRRHAFVAPSGENLPKITAAIAINPCPTITLGRNWLMVARVTNAPPSPAKILTGSHRYNELCKHRFPEIHMLPDVLRLHGGVLRILSCKIQTSTQMQE